jgi:hypothetical protein
MALINNCAYNYKKFHYCDLFAVLFYSNTHISKLYIYSGHTLWLIYVVYM